MNVLNALHVRSRGLELTVEERATLERRVAFALDRQADRVRRVDVALEDVNGPKGGVDVKCHVHVALWDGVVVDVDARADTALAAVAAALGRVRRGLAKAHARDVAERRSSPSVRVMAVDDSVTDLAALVAS